MRSRRRKARSSLLAALLIGLMILPALASGDGQVITQEDLEALPTGRSFEDVLNLVPGAQVLGFNEDEQKALSLTGVDASGAQAYAFGDSTSDPPVLSSPGTVLTDAGTARFSYDDSLPWDGDWPANGTVVDGTVYFTAGRGPTPGVDYTLFWAAYQNPYPVEDMTGLWTNRGFVTSFPGSPEWRSSFEGDTWDGGFRMPTVQYGPNPWSFDVYEYVPPQSFDAIDFDGFGALTGDNLLLAVETEDLTAGTIGFQDGCWGVHLHESENGGPGYVSAFPPVPGRSCEEGFIPLFNGFTFIPGTFVYEQPPAPTTTTTTTSTSTTSSTTSTTTTTSTTLPATTPPPVSGEGEGGGGLVWLWVLVGLVVVGGGYGLYWWVANRGPCSELLARWKRLQKECDEARKRLKEREARLDEARRGLLDAEAEYREQDAAADALREQLARLQSAGRSSVTYGGTTYHRIPEGLVTAEGLQSILDSVQRQIDGHEANMQSWQDSVDHWKDLVEEHEANVAGARAEAKEKCAEAAAAKKELEDCLTPEPPASEPEPESGTGGSAGGTPPPTEGGGEGGTAGGGVSGPGVAAAGGGPEEETPPECSEGDTREEELERKSFVVPASASSVTISIEPPTEEFAEWMSGQMEAAGGWFSPTHLNDPSLSSTIRGTLDGLDSGMAVSHEVRIEIPRREVTYACIQHWRCSGGQWVKAHRERRQVGRRDLTPIVIQESGKTDSRRVAQLISQAQSRYRQLVANDDSISEFCP